jgi:ABC-type multidrug transport system ATPase subunit
MPLCTVREALEFSSEMRLPADVSHALRAAFVDEAMELLELTQVADAKVGLPGSPDGLAPGERKRLTIGVELAANPAILFLDEPTTGLDARAAAVVVRVLRNVAASGRTVVATIHQPNPETVASLDDLLVLARGEVLFWGPREDGWEVLKIERGVGNIADHFLTLASSS